jgi:hypothetical protein
MKVTLPDDLLDAIEAANPSLKVVSPTGVASTALLQILRRLAPIPVNANLLVLHGGAYNRLIDLLGLGALRSPEAFVAAVERLHAVKIEGVEVSFSPGERDELQRRAERAGRTVEEEILAVVRGMHEQFFSQPIGV